MSVTGCNRAVQKRQVSCNPVGCRVRQANRWSFHVAAARRGGALKKHGSSAFGSPRVQCSMDLVHPRRLWQLHLLLQLWQGMLRASYVQVIREKLRLPGRLVLPCQDAAGTCTSETFGFGLNIMTGPAVQKEFLTKATWSPAGA